MIKRFFLLAVLCIAVSGWAQDAKLNLTNLEKLSGKAENVTDVSLDGSMLKLAAQAMDKDKQDKDKAAKELLGNLQGVYVKAFEFSKENQYSQQDLDAVRAQLQGPGWTRAVNVREEKTHETTEVYLMKSKDGDGVVGLAVLVAEPKELTIVNVVGPIDLNKLGALGSLGNLGNLGASMPQLKKREPEKATPPPQKKPTE